MSAQTVPAQLFTSHWVIVMDSPMSTDSILEPTQSPMDIEEEPDPIDINDHPIVPRELLRTPAVIDRDLIAAPNDDLIAPVPPPRDRFRAAAVKFFLTFPRCDTPAAAALARIRERFGESHGIKWCVVSQEKHQDGSNHLHVALWLGKRFSARSSRCFDFVAGQHGNYETMSKPAQCVKYVIKDGDFVYYSPDAAWTPQNYVDAAKSKKGATFQSVAVSIKSGATLHAIDRDHPGFVMQHLRAVKSYVAYQRSVSTVPLWPLVPPIPADQHPVDQPSAVAVYNWILENMYPTTPRPFRTPQLMIIGGTMIGKTSLLLSLERYFRPYRVPLGEDFYDAYDDDLYDFIVLDEYRHQKTIPWLNNFIDGSPMTLRVKGGQIDKRRNLPVIMCSNFLPEREYADLRASDPDAFAAYMARWLVVRVPADENLHWCTDVFGRP